MVRINYQRTNKPMEGYAMKLTGILKDKVDKAETMEAKKDIIADAGMELTDEELAGVSGGRKYAIPREDITPHPSDVYDPIPEVPMDLDPSLLHW